MWNINTGARDGHFKHCHGSGRLTAMALDAQERRLITGSNNGELKMWNFNSGSQLREFVHTEEHVEYSYFMFLHDPDRQSSQVPFCTPCMHVYRTHVLLQDLENMQCSGPEWHAIITERLDGSCCKVAAICWPATVAHGKSQRPDLYHEQLCLLCITLWLHLAASMTVSAVLLS